MSCSRASWLLGGGWFSWLLGGGWVLFFKYGEFTQIKGTLYFTIFSQKLNIKKYILETWYVYHNQIVSSFSPIDVDLYIPPNFPLNIGFEKL